METDRSAALGNLQIAVTAFERQLGAVDDLPTAALEELKRALDDVRLRLWSILMAANSRDYRGFLERVRLRRAAEILSALVADVDAGVLHLAHREATDLANAVREVEQRLQKVPKVL